MNKQTDLSTVLFVVIYFLTGPSFVFTVRLNLLVCMFACLSVLFCAAVYLSVCLSMCLSASAFRQINALIIDDDNILVVGRANIV